MMEQGSLADLLTLAKSGDDNKLAERTVVLWVVSSGCGGS